MAAPQAIIVAGPNGSGKTTFALEYLQQYAQPYLSADAIADEMAAPVEEVRVEAGKRFLRGISAEIQERHSFLVESTLSGLTFKRLIRQMAQSGYEVSIVFIFLRSADACVARILERVRKGGHPVPEADARRRFSRSIRNFWRLYRPLVDHWYLYYNGGVHFHEVALGEADSVEVRDEDVFERFRKISEGHYDECDPFSEP